MEPLTKYITTGLPILNIVMTIWVAVSGDEQLNARLDWIEMKVSACK